MSRILILFAHPSLEKSRVHCRLIQRIPASPGITLHDLYEAYPDFAVDVEREQALLIEHDVIVLQHPLFWYSTPPLVKQWEDLVLEHGWAYGSAGNALQGKRMLSLLTTGGDADAYCTEGYNRFTIRQFLAPIEGTARLCGMEYLPPYVIYGTHRMTVSDIDRVADTYGRLLRMLERDELDVRNVQSYSTLNEAVKAEDSEEARP